MRRPLAALFVSALAAGCGGDSNPPSVSIGSPNPPPPTVDFSLRFFGTGSGDIDRVKIPLLAGNGTSRPVNIGATDLTLEFWIKGNAADNPTSSCTAGANARGAWTSGSVVIDRDMMGDGDFGDYGVALFNGQVAFGIAHGTGGTTACGGRNVLDGAWHHVAVTRRFSSGELRIFVDGAQDVLVGDTSNDIGYNPAHLNPVPNDPFLVLGAEKFDASPGHAFKGLIDELRLSNVVRYTGNFVAPSAAFVVDTGTAALYHFDESSGADIIDASNGDASPGVLIPAASGAASHRSTDTPF